MNNKTTTGTRDEAFLVSEWKRISRLMANEMQSENEARPLRRLRDQIQAELDALAEKQDAAVARAAGVKRGG